MNFDIGLFLEKLVRRLKFIYNLTRKTGTFHEDQYIFSVISLPFLLRMNNISDKSCRENQNTNFTFNNFSSKIVLFMR